uniref:Uncharacterized protein n=1 Tax=Quercus lobata TaxID=97700 RepID=A0A7N2MEN9_QUELO
MVVVGSFLPSNQQEQKPKKLKNESTPAIFTPATTMAVIPFSGAEDDEGLGGNGHPNSGTPRPNLASSSSFRKETGWPCTCRTLETAFFKNAATAFPLSRVFQEHGSTPGPIAAFTKCGYRPALKPHFAQEQNNPSLNLTQTSLNLPNGCWGLITHRRNFDREEYLERARVCERQDKISY